MLMTPELEKVLDLAKVEARKHSQMRPCEICILYAMVAVGQNLVAATFARAGVDDEMMKVGLSEVLDWRDKIEPNYGDFVDGEWYGSVVKYIERTANLACRLDERLDVHHMAHVILVISTDIPHLLKKWDIDRDELIYSIEEDIGLEAFSAPSHKSVRMPVGAS